MFVQLRLLLHRQTSFLARPHTQLVGRRRIFQSFRSARHLEPPVAYRSKGPDPYCWLKENTERTRDHLKKENDYTRAWRNQHGTLERTIREQLGRWHVDQDTKPESIDGVLYYIRFEEDQEYPLYCRRIGDKEEVLIDQNVTDVAVLKVSSDHKLLAWTEDMSNMEKFRLKVKNISTGKILAVIDNVRNMEWTKNNKIIYTLVDHLYRPCKVFVHTLGEPVSKDVCIFSEPDDSSFVDVVTTKDKKYIAINCNSKTTSEIHLIRNPDDTSTESSTASPLIPRNSEFFIITNGDGAYNYTVLKARDEDIFDQSKWAVVVPHSPLIKIEDVDVFKDFIALYERHNGLQRIRILEFPAIESSFNPALSSHFIPIPFPVGSIAPGINMDFGSDSLRFEFSSPIIPPVTYDYHVNSRELLCIDAKTPMNVDYDPNNFTCSCAYIPSTFTKTLAGGEDKGELTSLVEDEKGEHLLDKPQQVMIPLTIAHRRHLKLDGKNPTLVRVYGAYGHNNDPHWRSSDAFLMSQGWVIALAHVRGGCELGRLWYEYGKLRYKKNSFYDFIDSVNYLIDNNYTSPQYLAAKASSAGGLVLGATANLCGSKKFKAMIASVPFVDVMSTMTDPSLPLTKHEYDEWGNPEANIETSLSNLQTLTPTPTSRPASNYADLLRSYDPYLNVTPQEYPNCLVTASKIDVRVPYWGPAKWVAKLRREKVGEGTILLKVASDVGHFGGGKTSQAEETAFHIAFLYVVMGLRFGESVPPENIRILQFLR